MPCKQAVARHLLRDGMAKVVKCNPFTIQLLLKETDDGRKFEHANKGGSMKKQSWVVDVLKLPREVKELLMQDLFPRVEFNEITEDNINNMLQDLFDLNSDKALSSLISHLKQPGVPELRWAYGTQDGKWHLVGPEDRDYAHGIPQERMEKIGQEAAKTEYLSLASARARVDMDDKDFFIKDKEAVIKDQVTDSEGTSFSNPDTTVIKDKKPETNKIVKDETDLSWVDDTSGGNNRIICPANKEAVIMFRNVCQNWPKVDNCFGTACSYYPVTDKGDVYTIGMEPAIKGKEKELWMKESAISSKGPTADIDAQLITVDSEPNIIEVEGHKIEVTGNTFGAKLRNLRNILVEKIGVKKTKDYINGIVKSKNASKKIAEPVLKIAGVNIESGMVYKIITKEPRKIGYIEKIIQMADNSILIEATDRQGKEFKTLPENIKKVFSVEHVGAEHAGGDNADISLSNAKANWDNAKANWAEAKADWAEAITDWAEANADWAKAKADWDKANADWDKAKADWAEAKADWDKAITDWAKANADLVEAKADWDKAKVDWDKARLIRRR